MFYYTEKYFSHVITTFFAFLSFYLIFMYKKEITDKPWIIILSGISAGLSILMYYPTAIVSFLILFYLAYTTKKIKPSLQFIAGFLLPIIILMTYHYIIFGNPLSIPHQYTSHTMVLREREFGALSGIPFALPSIVIIFKLFFSLEAGIFLYMPISIICLFALIISFKKKSYYPEKILFALIIITHILYNSTKPLSWHGDGAFGPRFLTSMIPFMMIGLAFYLKDKKKINPIIILTSAVSIIINLLAVLNSHPYGLGLITEKFGTSILRIIKNSEFNYGLLRIFSSYLISKSSIIIFTISHTAIMILLFCFTLKEELFKKNNNNKN